MKALIALAAMSILSQTAAAGEKRNEVMMSLDDRFLITPSAQWNVEIQKYMTLRFADVKITPKSGHRFSLMLYFKCDTPDLAQFDSPEKVARSVRSSSKVYLQDSVEKAIELKRLDVKGWYGCYAVFTDAQAVKQKSVQDGEFKYITRGMVRLSADSALGFSLMTNELGTPQYQELLDYVSGFVKPKK